MNAHEFVERLIASYPPNLRPDGDYVREIMKSVKKQAVTSEEFEYALDLLKANSQYFPTVFDIKQSFDDAGRISVRGKHEPAWEYFDKDGYSYARRVDINPNGELMRKNIPYGAENYQLAVPYEMQADKEWLTLEQAYDAGAVSQGLYDMMTAKEPEKRWKSRFEKIGE